ncbi:MAG TPA: YDG domain-containing protein, partial [Steroidobacteraceae bacterium]|nr:YDG domain-containing protein [Steroidobacteraceae bacterium]
TNATVALSDNHFGNDVVSLFYNNAAFNDKNVGTAKQINVSGIGIGGPDGGNYTLGNATAVASANITAAQLAVTASGVDKVYDGNTNATVFFTDNRITGDALNVGYAAANFESEAPGTNKLIDVTGIDLTGVDAANYIVSGTTTARANITPTNQSNTPTDVVVDYLPAVLNTTNTGVNGNGASVVPSVTIPSMPTTIGDSPAAVDDAVYVPAGNLGGNLRTSDTLPGVFVILKGRSARDTQLGDVEVQLVSIPSTRRGGVISVSVPDGSDQYAQGFAFSLPRLVADTANGETVSLMTMSGGPIPDWLQYEPSTKTFVISNSPSVVLPMQVQVRIGNQSWVIRINKRRGSNSRID